MTRCFFFLAIFILSACGKHELDARTDSSSTCPQKTAMIRVGDTFLEHYCGCAEAQGARAQNGSQFSCTVAPQTHVIFMFDGSTLSHQIRSTGSAAFQSSPVVFRDAESKQPYSVYFEQAGTYTFDDPYQPQIQGRIVVR